MRIVCIFVVGMIGIVFPVLAQSNLVLAGPGSLNSDVSTRVLKEAYQRIGIEIQVKKLPAQRALITSNEGKVDGEVNRIAGMENNYPNLIMVPVPINKLEGVIFTKNISFDVNGWDSLKPYKIGIRKGSKFAEKGTKGMSVQPVATIKHLFLKLDGGRNDIVVTSYLNGLHQIKMLKLKGIQALEPPVTTLNMYHYLHKKNEAIVPEITKVLQEMEAEGRIMAIRQKAVADLLR